MPKTRDYTMAASTRPVEVIEMRADRDAILNENEALRQLIDEIRMECELLKNRAPSRVSYH